jgi:ferredoxin-NADP reductase/ferredoxin
MQVFLDGAAHELEHGESVLGCLLRHGIDIPYFCRSGVCQTCVMKTTQAVPAAAQIGLKVSQKQLGCFLACVCKPESDITVERCEALRTYPSRITAVETITADVLRVTLERPAEFDGQAGQFIQLARPGDKLMRPYSIASLRGQSLIELHVALLPGGQMSQWLRQAQGEAIEFRGPVGDCIYVTGEPERPLLLAGTGTGLSPLLGVVREALAAGHRGEILLIHGARNRDALYAWAELAAMAASAPQLTVMGSVLEALDSTSSAGTRSAIEQAPIDELAARAAAKLGTARVYLAGNPERVQRMRKQLYLQGVPLARIHADPFIKPARAAS